MKEEGVPFDELASRTQLGFGREKPSCHSATTLQAGSVYQSILSSFTDGLRKGLQQIPRGSAAVVNSAFDLNRNGDEIAVQCSAAVRRYHNVRPALRTKKPLCQAL
jgi:hypothetical protein